MTKTSTKQTMKLLLLLVLVIACLFAAFVSTQTAFAADDYLTETELFVGDKIGFMYYTSYPYSANVTMKFTVNGRTSTSNAIHNGASCAFKFDNLYPHELDKEIIVELYNGSTLVATRGGLTMKSLLLQQLQSATATANAKQLAADLLYYGEQTRLYRNLNVPGTERDDVSILDGVDDALYSAYTPKMLTRNPETDITGETTGLGNSASAVRMKSIGISYYNTNRYVVYVEVPSEYSYTNVTVRIGDTSYSGFEMLSKGNNIYAIESKAILACDILKSVDFTLYYNGKAVQSATYSCADYVRQLRTTDDSYQALMYAESLYYYGDSANKVYPAAGKYVIAAYVSKNPSNIKPTSQNNVTPTDGAVTAVYSDDTTGTVSASWGSVNGITGKTTSAPRTSVVTYTDSATGKVFTMYAPVTLTNELVSISRWHDPDNYSPTTTTGNYTPTTGSVKATWSNGYAELVTPTYSSINRAAYAATAFTQITIPVSYTHNGITKTTDVKMIWDNRPVSLTLTGTHTATFTGGAQSVYPTSAVSSPYITFKSGATEYLASTLWATAVSYTGTDVTTSLTNQKDTRIFDYSDISFTKYDGTSVSSSTTSTVTGPKVTLTSNEVIVNVINREVSVSVAPGASMSTYQVTGTSVANGSSLPSGDSITITLGNGKTRTSVPEGASVSWKHNTSITDGTYSRSATITYTYTKTDGNTLTYTANALLVNPVSSISVPTSPEKQAVSYSTAYLSITKSDVKIKLTYANGTTASNVTPTGIRSGSYNVTTLYFANITGTSTSSSESVSYSNSALTSNSGTPTAYYTDSGGNIKTATFSIQVKNPMLSVEASDLTLTAASYSTARLSISDGTFYVVGVMQNGIRAVLQPATYTKMYLNSTQYSTIYVNNITDASTSVNRTTAYSVSSGGTAYTITLKTTYGGVTLTSNPKVIINNPVSSIARRTDIAKKATGTGTVSGSSWYSGNTVDGAITVTYANGKTGNVTLNSSSGALISGSTSLTDTSSSKSAALTVVYGGQTCTVYGYLYNDISAPTALTSPDGNSTSNRVTLSSSGASVTFSGTYTFSNGKTTAQTGASTFTTVGSTNVTTTTSMTGSGTVSATLSPTGSLAAVTGYKNGSSGQTLVAARTYPSCTKSITVYWKNPVASITSINGSSSGSVNLKPNGNTTSVALRDTNTFTVKLKNGQSSTNRTATLVSYSGSYITTGVGISYTGTCKLSFGLSESITANAKLENQAVKITLFLGATAYTESAASDTTYFTYTASATDAKSISAYYYTTYENGQKSSDATASVSVYSGTTTGKARIYASSTKYKIFYGAVNPNIGTSFTANYTTTGWTSTMVPSDMSSTFKIGYPYTLKTSRTNSDASCYDFYVCIPKSNTALSWYKYEWTGRTQSGSIIATINSKVYHFPRGTFDAEALGAGVAAEESLPMTEATPATSAGSSDYVQYKVTGGGITRYIRVYGPSTSSGGGGCFDAGTQITMANGTTKNIEDVKTGEYVMSYNEVTGTYEPCKVTGTLTHHNTTNMLDIYLSDGTHIGATACHPILTNEGWASLDKENALREHWIDTVDLKVGQTIVGHDNATITKIVWRDNVANYDTYNITVSKNHTYIANDCVVHNVYVKEAL